MQLACFCERSGTVQKVSMVQVAHVWAVWMEMGQCETQLEKLLLGKLSDVLG